MRVHHQLGLVAVLCAGFLTTARAEKPKSSSEKIELKLNLPKGEKKTFVTIEDINMQVSVAGQSVDMKTKTTIDSEVESKGVESDGVSTLDVIYKRIQLDATGQLEMSYDSDDPNTANNLLGQKMHGMAGKNVTMKFKPNGKLVEEVGEEKAKGPAKLKESVGQMFAVLPDKPVAIGDSWEHESKVESDPTMPMEIASKYTLKEVRDGVAYVKVDAKISSKNGMKGTMEGDIEIDQKTGLQKKAVVNITAEGKQGPASFKLDGVMKMDLK
jgi:hypothetical protein